MRRELYPRHTAFFAAGAEHRERLMMAANRVGKTEGVGAYEVTCHLTGRYPAWWKGKRFSRAVKVWAAGDTSKTVREIIQAKLLGELGHLGEGMIPGDLIRKTTRKSGVAGAIDTAWVRHVSGGTSLLVLKSYDQRRESFQGTEQDVIWLDEEPPLDVYTECLMRTMTTGGLVLLTFTPLRGLSDVVLSFLPEGDLSKPAKFAVFCTWDEAPHLSDEVKQELWRSIPAHQREARSKGIPSLGAGAIYPVPEADIIAPDFQIPEHWPRAYGLDVAWNNTAAVWGAWDRETDTLYLYSEHYQGEAEPSVHAAAIRARGAWLQGAIDPAARGRSQVDGRQLLQMYTDLGLRLAMADNAVEAGIYRVWERLSSGRLKVFQSLGQWRSEFRLYRRDEKGRVVKQRDHLMDAARYLAMELPAVARTAPKPKPDFGWNPGYGEPGGWMR
ncbi:MAG: terminase family protein [Bryobacteraceae bacterium]|nr:terminase family protein [Bryobacteraceae bacterium]